ncbi:hypothetical protein C493_20035 [Natronolimnohabitans innermongolicus JCM 12255]|uniref:DUF8014 domain-containing protein n=2 Tax=Natronolimnohabitans innermongolicus TaxID=253107 RepID=L9WKD2_9EURY|nr:hypothetical protein C493_20035 [Natronolimnohabitans innermongolicus JCM 12255]
MSFTATNALGDPVQDRMECPEPDCERSATVELHIPWTDNRLVCAAHARVLGRQDGVVADPVTDRGEALLE